MKVVLVTNIPAPYRIPVYELIKKVDITIAFCSKSERNRNWKQKPLEFKHAFLEGTVNEKTDGLNFIHNNPAIWSFLNQEKPNIIITTGFNPTHLYAFIWAKMYGAKHICMTDGSVYSESKLSPLHKWVRRIVFLGSHSFIAASKSGAELYKSYGIADRKIFRSPLAVNNARYFSAAKATTRNYDVCFSGQFHDRKLPFFFVEVCAEIRARTGTCKALLMGDGPLRDMLLERLCAAGIDFHYQGFVEQEDLPTHYASAKILLFPSLNDTWGVVTNEAMAAGTPVITTPFAGVADELVIDGKTGYVRDINVNAWADVVMNVLQDDHHRNELAKAGQELVKEYNFDAAAEGIEAACIYVNKNSHSAGA